MKIYVSIPITGFNEKKVRERADMVKARLSRDGNAVVTPFEVYAGKHPTYDDYICCDLRAMLDCDAVYFCDGWEQSTGCNIEHEVVMRYKAHGKKDFKVMYEN
jgi:hypothetical protein